ncbi:MAG: HAD hydrolase-like protein [Pseudomonadota bacterium]|nr:HAD hydrolase-like protein [Pseudomonadota bacterium]MDO7711278.1 HAD hydrolase-like protein [Pseudomonadota bacterium]
MAAVNSVDCVPEEVFMIGDDAEADVEGALKAGLRACLVQTGKYRQGDESRILSLGRECVPSVVEAISPFL